jgi:hypothetical protein
MKLRKCKVFGSHVTVDELNEFCDGKLVEIEHLSSLAIIVYYEICTDGVN